MVKNIRSVPWFELYQNNINRIKEKNGVEVGRKERKWAYRFARLKYKFLNPKEPERWYEHMYNNYLANKVREPVYEASNWFLTTAFIAQFGDDFASKFEVITGMPKRRAQNVNVFWSSLDHVFFVYGSSKLAFEGGYSELVKDVGTFSFYFTSSFAALNLGWNGFRLFNKGNKVYPSFGYGGVVSNLALYIGKNRDNLVNSVSSTIKANHHGSFIDYDFYNLPVYDSENNLVPFDGSLINQFPSKSSNLESIVEKDLWEDRQGIKIEKFCKGVYENLKKYVSNRINLAGN